MDHDLSLIDRLERLYAAVVADCLDRLGARSQVLDPRIRPLTAAMKVAGYAATVRCVEVDAVPESRDDWYRGELAAVDALQPGDVMVVSTCRGSYWGELLATASSSSPPRWPRRPSASPRRRWSARISSARSWPRACPSRRRSGRTG